MKRVVENIYDSINWHCSHILYENQLKIKMIEESVIKG